MALHRFDYRRVPVGMVACDYRMRRAARIDANQSEIAAAFVALGCSVRFLHTVGSGFPDLLVATMGINLPVECKVKNGKRTPAQEKFAKEWKGMHSTVRDIKSVEVVVKMMREYAMARQA